MTADTSLTAAATPDSVADQALASFHSNTKHHTLAVLHDDGLYRHLRFRHDKAECAAAEARGEKACRSAGSAWWFDLVTWPGNLAITGDCSSYLFGRGADEDMLAFFRGQRINPGYWAEKVKASDGDSGVRRYSADVFLRQVAEEAAACEPDFPGLAAAVQAAVTDELFNAEDQAREFLNDFEYQPPPPRAAFAFRFAGAWEWDLRDYAFHYLWACHAITWGIPRYDEVKAHMQPVTKGPPK